MVIRGAQMNAFEKAQRERFVNRMVVHLQNHFADDLKRQGIREPELKELVRTTLDRAEAMGLAREDHLQLFVECVPLLGGNFDTENRVVRELLNARELDLNERMVELSHFLLFGLESSS
jgi:hypothetical protein